MRLVGKVITDKDITLRMHYTGLCQYSQNDRLFAYSSLNGRRRKLQITDSDAQIQGQ